MQEFELNVPASMASSVLASMAPLVAGLSLKPPDPPPSPPDPLLRPPDPPLRPPDLLLRARVAAAVAREPVAVPGVAVTAGSTIPCSARFDVGAFAVLAAESGNSPASWAWKRRKGILSQYI